jgi:hypothetical protein
MVIWTPLQIIKIVIENKLNDTVGGVLQHGLFKNDGNFSLSGVTEDIISDDTGELKRVSHFLGFELSGQKVSNEYPMLYITYGTTPVDWKHPKWKD